MQIEDETVAVDTSDRLQEAFVPSDLPPMAPDGGPVLTPAPIRAAPALESVCDRGPCRHLHVIRKVMDVAKPMDGSSLTRPKLGEDGMPIISGYHPDGEPIFEQEEGYEPIEALRNCYPCNAPVRLDLSNDDPVLECNLWDPEDPEDPEVVARENRRSAWAVRQAQDNQSEGVQPRVRGKR